MFISQDFYAKPDGIEVTWPVPPEVTHIQIECWGARNKKDNGATVLLGLGGYCTGWFDVSSTPSLRVCAGTTSDPIGSKGGVAGGIADGGGSTANGGAAGSYVRPLSSTQEIKYAWIVAGGAGGVGAEDPLTFYIPEGGGTQGETGAAGHDYEENGKGGTQTEAGKGGTGVLTDPGHDGVLGNGGDGKDSVVGGGGGGFWGGGGGNESTGSLKTGSGGGGSGGFLDRTFMLSSPVEINVNGSSGPPNPDTSTQNGFVRITNASPLCVGENTQVSVFNVDGQEQCIAVKDIKTGMMVKNLNGETWQELRKLKT